MSLRDPEPPAPPCPTCGDPCAYGKRACVEHAHWPDASERAEIAEDVRRYLAPRVPPLGDVGPLED